MSFLDLKSEFPAVGQILPLEGNPRLVYLDSAATTLKPRKVIERLSRFYTYEAANVHRGMYYLSRSATDNFEKARTKVANFVGAADPSEIIFTKGTTESINLVANSFGEEFLHQGDVILLTEMEHHANIVPWQLLAKKKNLELRFVPVLDNGHLDLESLSLELERERVKLLAFTAISNTLGTINPVSKIVKMARDRGVKTLVDGAQWVSHEPTRVQEWGCDFFAFSGHKIFAPMGVGVLYGKKQLLNQMPPYQSGGAMIDRVDWSGTSFLDSPFRFEAGTPNVGGVLALAEAIDFVEDLGWDALASHFEGIVEMVQGRLSEISGYEPLGTSNQRAPIFSFNMSGLHASDVSFFLDQYGVSVRSGHHCTQPLLKRFGLSATARASFSIYNDEKDVDTWISSLKKVRELAP